MNKNEKITVPGKVIKAMPNILFQVELENGRVIIAHLAGKLRQNFIKIIEGDDVEVEISAYDTDKGRITYRR